MPHRYIDLLPEVARALAVRQPIVALESTIIAHGMPFPQNVETALRLEDEVRAHGAVPATIAVLDGRIKVGMAPEEIAELGRIGRNAAKVSRRDLPIVLATNGTGATTVAGTMIIAALAGIRVFATGGLGGVHRGAQVSMDISADLPELARTSVAVVCAGAKSVLDLALTLEYLETHGVPVLGYQTNEFPAFFSRESGLPVDARCETPAEVAEILRASWALGHAGVVVANPIPHALAMSREVIDAATACALADAQDQGIVGKSLTPFLLARVNELTNGDSLAANIGLVLNNARLAALVAVAFSEPG